MTAPAHDGAHGYERCAEAFMAARERASVGTAEVSAWHRTLPPGARVLDAGCGHGEPITRTLLDAGRSVWGVDASPTLVAAFRSRFPGVEVECARVETSELFGGSFDGVVAWGLIFLLDPDVQPVVLTRLVEALKPGGRLLFTAPAEIGSWTDVLTGEPSTSLGADAYVRILREAGAVVTERFRDPGGNHYYAAQRMLTRPPSLPRLESQG